MNFLIEYLTNFTEKYNTQSKFLAAIRWNHSCPRLISRHVKTKTQEITILSVVLSGCKISCVI